MGKNIFLGITLSPIDRGRPDSMLTLLRRNDASNKNSNTTNKKMGNLDEQCVEQQ